MVFTRRNFLEKSLLASGSVLVPRFLKAFESPLSLPASLDEKVLVVVQLSGGNDGLNTIVPYRNDTYYKLRPGIGLAKDKLHRLTDYFAFNPAMAPLQKWYDEGMLTIFHGVGYPNPDLSHFRSMDIWQSGSGSENMLDTGWLGRYLDATCTGNSCSHRGLEADGYLSLAMKGEQINGMATADPQKLLNSLRDPYLASVVEAPAHPDKDDNVAYLYKVMRDTYSSAQYLADTSKKFKSRQEYPASAFSSGLKTIASLINGHSSTKVYYVSAAGFDTHVNQLMAQEKALAIVAEGLNAFLHDLKSGGRLQDVAVMVFSEFGRRVAQNAGGGTDHGTANHVWLLSGALKKKGFYNNMPDLDALNDGNLNYTVDFRSIYSTLLHKWLLADDQLILKNKFNLLDFI